jgi:hypothetical protein
VPRPRAGTEASAYTAHMQIITVDGRDAGSLTIDYRPTWWDLADIAICPPGPERPGYTPRL